MSSPLSFFLPPSLQMTDEQFFEFCQVNQDLRIERDHTGAISIMPPVGAETGNREIRIGAQVMNWADEDGTGLAFSSSAGFTLSTGAERSPDASWISLDRWNTVSAEQQKRFAPICPDFVVELRSASDNLAPLQRKMEEYMAEPGCRLGFLIDRKNKRVFVYRSSQPVDCLENPMWVSAEPELAGFTLKLKNVW